MKRGREVLGLRQDAWVLLVPALVPIMVLSAVPLLYGIALGFTGAESGAGAGAAFNGLDNYRELLSDTLFWTSIRVGLIWALTVTALQFLLALGLALLLNANLRLRWLARTLALVPWAMPPIVIGIMWRLVYHPDAGILNQTLVDAGLIQQKIDWLADFSFALPAVVLVGVWSGMPQTTITLLAGLQNVPPELHEAAAIDGASAWRRFWTVTVPALRPVILAITALDFIWNFNSFALVYVLTGGGPGGLTRLPGLFAYEEAFRYGQFGYAAALGNVMVVVIGVLLILYLRARRREEVV